MTFMSGSDFDAILDYLVLDDEKAGVVFGMRSAEINLMRHGALTVPFLVSAMTALMCKSDEAARLALEHGRAFSASDPCLQDMLSDTAGVMILAKRRPALRIVRDDG